MINYTWAARRIEAAWYTACNTGHYKAGARWYGDARALAAQLATAHNLTTVQAAAIIAVLSPMTSWENNVTAAQSVVEGAGPLPGFAKNVEKANRILEEDNEDAVARHVGGPKVNAFWRAIAGDDSAVVLDRHSIRIACGWALTHTAAAKLIRPAGAYGRLAKVYREVAAKLEISPATLQATTWLWYRSLGSDE